MIDSITLRSHVPFKPSERAGRVAYSRPGRLVGGEGYPSLLPWKISIPHHSLTDGEGGGRQFDHQDNGMRVRISLEPQTSFIQASLPRLLYGSNGRLLKSEKDLSDAMSRLYEFAGEILRCSFTSHLFLSRLDLVLNLPIDPRRVLAIMRHARHPKIRRQTSEYTSVMGDTLFFSGVNTQIRFYNKRAQVLGAQNFLPKGDSISTRVEVSLRGGETISRNFGGTKSLGPSDLSFQACYQVWRSILCAFGTPAPPKKETDLVVLLASMMHAGVPIIGGTDPFDHYVQNKAPSTIREMRRRVQAVIQERSAFSWDSLLPKYDLPDVVDVFPNGEEVLISRSDQDEAV